MDLSNQTLLPAGADQVLIAVNPRAGRGPVAVRVERLREKLAEQGFAAHVCTVLDEVCCRANQLHAEGRLRALVGVGGDGTAAELVNRTNPGVPVTLLPAGTANLLARHYRLPSQPEKLAQIIQAGTILRLDAGRAGPRIFLLMVGCGFDAEVVHRVHAYRQNSRGGGHISYWSYLKPILQAIRSYSYPEIRIYWDEAGETKPSVADRCRWMFACNLPRYGWSLPLAPAAVATDGRVGLVCLQARVALAWSALWRRPSGLARVAGRCVTPPARFSDFRATGGVSVGRGQADFCRWRSRSCRAV